MSKPVFNEKLRRHECPQCRSTRLILIQTGTTPHALATFDGHLRLMTDSPAIWTPGPTAQHGYCGACHLPLTFEGMDILPATAQMLTWDDARHKWACPVCRSSYFMQSVSAENEIALTTHDKTTLIESDGFAADWANMTRRRIRCVECGATLAIPPAVEILDNAAIE